MSWVYRPVSRLALEVFLYLVAAQWLRRNGGLDSVCHYFPSPSFGGSCFGGS